ncbi:hypothetical protein HDZ31DRAFT_62218 [Schizophyllum fasciatum]
MSDGMGAALAAHAELLGAQYTAHLPAVLELQTVFLHDLLPALADELQLPAPAQAAARAWLQDSVTLFHIARRNQWTRTCAMDAARKTLGWRLAHLPPSGTGSDDRARPPPGLLPRADPAGRPVLVLRLRDVPARAPRAAVLAALERLRAHLCRTNRAHAARAHALQYLVVLDLAGAALPALDLDLLSWTLREAVPRFPGLVAAALVVNYSWAHSGLRAVAKRLLPEAGLGRVWFPTQEELVGWLGEENLPEEYGGTLEWRPPSPSPSNVSNSTTISSSSTTPPRPPSPTCLARAVSLSPLSLLNPFFGYPARSHYTQPGPNHPSRTRHTRHPSHTLPHGRRRRRDLARTLLLLLWARWGALIRGVLWAILLVWAGRRWRRLAGAARGKGRGGVGRVPAEWDMLLAMAFTGFGV